MQCPSSDHAREGGGNDKEQNELKIIQLFTWVGGWVIEVMVCGYLVSLQ